MGAGAKGIALITGASSGIGAELAELCAAGGFNVLLTGRRADLLSGLAERLSGAHRVEAETLAVDLADREAPHVIAAQVSGRPVEILINNAGFGLHGPFAEIDWGDQAHLLQVNMIAPAHLTRLLLPDMLRRRRGRILNVASTAAFVPGPFMATYYASKAFLLSLSEALANEVRGSGVTVTALCPGPTRTGFGEAAGVEDSNLFAGPVMTAAEVARIGYRAMMTGEAEVVAGARNRWMMRGARLLPRMKLAEATRRLNSKR